MCSKNPSLMFKVNIEGTENMINASNKANVESFVYTSSAVTIGEAHGAQLLKPHHRGTFLSKYEESKYFAEEKAFSLIRTLNLSPLIRHLFKDLAEALGQRKY